ncbi:hypothetical protein N7540_003318 [Penicillium herquei]|nr:hypothetical protein N7540_003318 [Penicillium herquei]
MGCCFSSPDPQTKEHTRYLQNVNPDWTKESLRDHIAKTGIDIADTAIDVLWSCFYFFAWHPFPRSGDVENAKIQRPEFDRALALLAYKGTELLGTFVTTGNNSVNSHWAFTEATSRSCLCRHNIDRIFRSISKTSSWAHGNESCHSSATRSSYLNDELMDLLVTTQPPYIKSIPGSRPLEPPARRLLEAEGANNQYQLPLNNLATLVSLLCRIKLYQATWDQRNRDHRKLKKNCHYGILEKPSAHEDELVNFLVQPFELDKEGFLTPHAISRALDLLPNLELGFHQLWAIIFQPSIPEPSQALVAEPLQKSTIGEILRAVSFFVPPIKRIRGAELHGIPEDKRNIMPVTFESIYESSTQESNIDSALSRITEIVTESGDDRKAHLILFLEDENQNLGHIPRVMGTFYSAKPKIYKSRAKIAEEKDTAEQTKTPEVNAPLVGLPELLFQLQPNFSLYRLNEKENLSKLPLHGFVEGNYCIGDPEVTEIKIDPVTREATFVASQVATNWNETMYKDVTGDAINSEKSGEKIHHDIKASFIVAQIAVFEVNGGDVFHPPYVHQ